MTRTGILALCVTALASGCAPNPTQLRISTFLPFDEATCFPVAESETFPSGGRLDITGGGIPGFYVGYSVEGGDSFHQPAVTVAGREIETEDRNHPILDRVLLTYTAKPSSLGLSLAQAQYNRSIPLNNGAAVASVNLISDQAAQELVTKLHPGDKVQLDIAVELRGYMSGDRGSITTGPLVFPLEVVMNDPSTCAVFREYAGTSTCQQYPGSLPEPVCCTCAAGAMCDAVPAGSVGCP